MSRVFRLKYVNWRGGRAVRTIAPSRLFWGSTEFHQESQWLVEATDMDKSARRTFALDGFTFWGRLVLTLHLN